jgi:ferredoxin
MPPDCYEALARHLDDLPGGFARTPTGVELRILRRLFTPAEAVLACQLALLAETPAVIARRAGLPLAETTRMLEDLSRRRLVYDEVTAGQPTRYMAFQFVVGFWEGQVDRLDADFARDFEEYLEYHARAIPWKKTPQLRTIPIKESIPVENVILAYEDVEQIVNSHQKFAVANCICRQEMRLLGQDDGKPLETCLAFDGGADYYLRSGRGRLISKDETLAILAQAKKAGLVLQPGNDRTSGNICMCCGCCCGVLRGIKSHPHPASQVTSPFSARLEPALCTGCGKCVKVCPMDALQKVERKAVFNPDRCIGCGLCVAACPSGALSLQRKPAHQQRRVPGTIVELYLSMAWSRGKLGPFSLARMAARSAADRIAVRLKPPQ